MIDSHAHLYFDKFDDDRSEVIARAREAGVSEIINIGIDVPTSHQAVELAQRESCFYAAVGLHPTSEISNLENDVDAIRAIATEESEHVVAIGEIGLDYYWDNVAPEDQKPRLTVQLALARELSLPVIFHCREALSDLFEVLDAEEDLPPGVFHCFSGTPADARRALALGFHVSFAGNVTYPTAGNLREAAAVVPPDWLLLETDAPFLAPQPRRGKRNESSFLPFTRTVLAELHGLEDAELDRITEATTRALFQLPGEPS
jgi:TatD DNase family protein